MNHRVLIVEGHPDDSPARFCHALADAYAEGATAAGHAVRRVAVASLDFPTLESRDAWESGTTPECIRASQDDITWCDHLVIVFPLWLGAMPARLKAYFEQVFRPGFAFSGNGMSGAGRKTLKGRSARVVVTMGMPGWLYRWYFGAHSLRSLERNILGFCGIGPTRDTIIGLVESGGEPRHQRWLDRMRDLGAKAG